MAALLVIGIFVVRHFGGAAASLAANTTHHTRDMSVMYMTFGMRALWSLVSVYLLTVSMRILGLLYVTNKREFGWFDH